MGRHASRCANNSQCYFFTEFSTSALFSHNLYHQRHDFEPDFAVTDNPIAYLQLTDNTVPDLKFTRDRLADEYVSDHTIAHIVLACDTLPYFLLAD